LNEDFQKISDSPKRKSLSVSRLQGSDPEMIETCQFAEVDNLKEQKRPRYTLEDSTEFFDSETNQKTMLEGLA
jgi:hypothetical protein